MKISNSMLGNSQIKDLNPYFLLLHNMQAELEDNLWDFSHLFHLKATIFVICELNLYKTLS